MIKRILWCLVSFLIGFGLFTVGCNKAAKKPIQPQAIPSDPQDASPATPQGAFNFGAPAATISSLATSEAGKVAGVKSAYAFTSGKYIYIGLELNEDLQNMEPVSVEKNVETQVKSMASGHVVLVTSDFNTVAEIKQVAVGVAQGKPASMFPRELKDINAKLMPLIKGERGNRPFRKFSQL